MRKKTRRLLHDHGDWRRSFVWQAADGTWQIWSCIHHTKCGGRTRLFYRWEGRRLTDSHWQPMGIAMAADASLGETYCYYSGHKQRVDYQFAILSRTSPDLKQRSEPE